MNLVGLRSADTWVLDCLHYMPMASAQDLSCAFGREASVVYRSLSSLESQGHVASEIMSCSRRRQRRWWLKDKGQADDAGIVSFSHSSNAVARLMDNPVATDLFYWLASSLSVTEYGSSIGRRMLEFCWFRNRAFDAAARYTDGWAAFFWSGFWQDRKSLDNRFEHLLESMEVQYLDERARPGLYCFVVPDYWQAQLVWDVARRHNIVDSLFIWVVERSVEVGTFEIQDTSRHWLFEKSDPDMVGFTPLDRMFRSSLIKEVDGAWLIRLMLQIEQWPGATKKTLTGFTRQSHGRVKSGLDRLVDRGMVRNHGGRYAAEGVWLANAARRDRVWSGKPGRHFSAEAVDILYDGRIQRHEQGLMRLMRSFAEAGCSIASGWRAYDVMGRSGQIAPDGVVFLNNSPYGTGWHYVEYELRAKGERLVDAKLRGYYSRVRADGYPVLVVCSPDAEEMFVRKGSDLRMMVTTVPEVKNGVLTSDGSEETVWRIRGQPVSLLG